MDKNYVGIGYAVCPVCGCKHSESVLIDKHMHNTLQPENFTGFELCAEHKAKHDEGYLALVAVEGEPPKAPLIDQYNWSLEHRTGELVHIRREAARKVFNIVVPEQMPMVWVEPAAVEKLKQLMGLVAKKGE